VKVNNNHELELGGSGRCIESISDGSIVKLSNDCKSKQSFWKALSTTNLILGTFDGK
jgi:hypothetical protein